MRNVDKAHFLRCQNPKTGIKQKDRFLCGFRNKKVLPIYHVLLQLQLRHFCLEVLRLECEVRTTVAENVTPCSLLETCRLPEELAASSSWPPPLEPRVLNVEKASEPTCFVSLFYAEGGGLHVS
jgi:hypothetical protein